MESLTIQDLLKCCGLSHRSSKKPVSDAHLEEISRSSCKQWKSLPSHLDLETIVASDIDRSQKDEREKRHDFFKKWKDIKGSGATYKQLINALLKIKCVQDAEKICQLLKESTQPSTPDGACALPDTGTSGERWRKIYINAVG
jgi:hypothetical protein